MNNTMTVVIFANGVLNQLPELDKLIGQAELVIAADGGANHCDQLGITPDILLGDFDSIDPAVLTTYQDKGVVIKRHPPQKDATDLELALDLAVARGGQTIWLLGVLGGRWDMSLANIMLAGSAKYQGQNILLAGQDCIMQILHAGSSHTITGQPDQKVSLLALQGDVRGVTLTGFAYPLTQQTIVFGSSLGVSNIMLTNEATVHHAEGTLLCVLFSE